MSRLTAPLIQKNRRRARLMLYGIPSAFFLLAFPAVWFLGDLSRLLRWQEVDYMEYESVRLFQRYLQINTGYPTGNEIPGAEFLARELEKDGITAHVERLGHRNANLWAVLEGDDRKALVMHNHIDVDPIAEPEQWEFPPMSGTILLPVITGRGAFDMKSLAIAQLMVMKKLRREEAALARSLVFLATGDEERDSWHGTRWFLRHHRDLWKRFEVVLTEGGAVEATDFDQIKFWGTEYLQKLYVEMEVCSSNRGALEALRADLVAGDERRGRVASLPPLVTAELDKYVRTRAHPDFAFYFDSVTAGLGGFARLPNNMKAMMRHDLSAFPVVGDPTGGYRMRVILQLLPWEDVETAVKTLLPDGLEGYSTSLGIPHGPVDLAITEHPIVEHINGRVSARYPDAQHGRLFVPWAATDARFFRAAGIPAFGFSPFVILTGDAAKITGPNERMALPAFVDGVELYEDFVRTWVLRDSD